MFKRYFSLFITISVLITSVILATVPIAKAQTPTIFIDPDKAVGNLTPAPGSATKWDIRVANIGAPGMIGHEFYIALNPRAFPDYKPITNGNFTAGASGWTPTVTGTTGTPTYGYDATEGNPAPGSGPGSYLMRTNSTAGAGGSRTFQLDSPTFEWTVGAPIEARLSFAYIVSGNSFGSASVGISIVKPGGATQTLISSKTFTSAKPWSYNFTETAGPAFTLSGAYKLRLRSVVTSLTAGVSNYVQIKWDDVGLQLAPIAVSEGPFLTSDPQNVGKTMFSARYMRFPTNTSLYVSDNLVGEPYTVVNPVQGSGIIANITLRAAYGVGYLDLWGTILLEAGLFPPYTPTPMTHTAVDAYFDNRLRGDITGPGGAGVYDGNVNTYDLGYLGGAFGASNAIADFTGPAGVPDGIVNTYDLGALGGNFGAHYP